MNYVAITTAKNEAPYLDQVIKSVFSQTIPPVVYVILDDDSTDDTHAIIKKYQKYGVIYHRIKGKRFSEKSYNICRGVNLGHKIATSFDPCWRFSLKLDADSLIPPDYVEKMLGEMERDGSLGIVSGTVTDVKMLPTRPSDGAKLYRRECWDGIGGLDYVYGWDSHAIIKSGGIGFKCKRLDVPYTQLRPSRPQGMKGWFKVGVTRFYLGFPLWHTILVGGTYLNDKPTFLGTITMILTHTLFSFTHRKKRLNEGYYRQVREMALKEILSRLPWLHRSA